MRGLGGPWRGGPRWLSLLPVSSKHRLLRCHSPDSPSIPASPSHFPFPVFAECNLQELPQERGRPDGLDGDQQQGVHRRL
eukprot:364323-Chlamydomonas_euryale.AAC.18